MSYLKLRLSIAKLRKLWYLLLTGLTCLITVVGYYPPALTQAGGPFVCDRTLYISQGLQGTPTTLFRVRTAPFDLEPVNETAAPTVEYNAIGFNATDGFIYAMAPQSVGANPPVVYRIDNSGAATLPPLGSPTGFPVVPAGSISNAFAGDIDRNGSYFVYVTNVAAGQPNLFQINLTTTPPSVVNSFILNNTNFTDIAFNPVDDQLYAFDNTRLQVARIDLGTSTVTYIGGAQANVSIPVGGAFFDPLGNFFIYDNTGNVLRAPNVANANPVVFDVQGSAGQATRFDGASCAFGQSLEKSVAPTTVPASGIVTYTYRFANTSSSDLANITFRDVMPDGRTFVAGTLTNPLGGTPNAFGGTQTLEITGLNLTARTIAEVTAQVQVPRTTLPGIIFNQSTISPIPDSSGNPNLPSDFPFNPDFPDSGQIPDPTPLIVPPTPVIGLAKAIASVVNLGNGNYQVTYNLVVENKGNVELNSIQVTEDLTQPFGTRVPPIPFTVNSVSSPSGGLTPNPNFNGSTDTNLLAGIPTDTLALGQSKTIALVVTITPGNDLGPFDNQAETTGQSPDGQTVRDLSNDGTNTDPDNDGDPTNNSVPTRLSLAENPVLGVAKNVVSFVDAGGGNFTATYSILAQNFGDVPLRNLQLAENLATTFGTTPFTVNRVSSSSGNLTPNSNFNGVADTNLLSGTDTLAVGETKTVELVVTLTPGNSTRTYPNTVQGTAQGPNGQPVRDQSTSGINPDPDGDRDPTNNNVPTPLDPTTDPRLRLVKRITNATRGGIPVNGINFQSIVNDPNDPNVNASGWSQLPGGGLLGVFRLGSDTPLQSGDEVEYTVYFLSDGAQPTTNINICDPIPEQTTFLPDSFGSGSGILLNQNGTVISQTNASDTDKGTFFSPLSPVTATCPNPNNPNGAVLLQLGDITNTAPNNVGFLRFRVRIN